MQIKLTRLDTKSLREDHNITVLSALKHSAIKLSLIGKPKPTTKRYTDGKCSVNFDIREFSPYICIYFREYPSSVRVPYAANIYAANIFVDEDQIYLLPEVAVNSLTKAIEQFNEEFKTVYPIKTFYYRSNKDGTQSRRLLEVHSESPNYIEGIDLDKGEFRRFLKKNVIGSIGVVG